MPIAAEQEEFWRLKAASGWSSAEIARQLKITPAHVSGLLNEDASKRSVPSETLLELFRLKVSEKLGVDVSSIGSSPSDQFMETTGKSDLEIWRRRAQAAESKLNAVREGLRELIVKSTPGMASIPRKEVSSEALKDMKSAALARKEKGARNPHTES